MAANQTVNQIVETITAELHKLYELEVTENIITSFLEIKSEVEKYEEHIEKRKQEIELATQKKKQELYEKIKALENTLPIIGENAEIAAPIKTQIEIFKTELGDYTPVSIVKKPITYATKVTSLINNKIPLYNKVIDYKVEENISDNSLLNTDFGGYTIQAHLDHYIEGRNKTFPSLIIPADREETHSDSTHAYYKSVLYFIKNNRLVLINTDDENKKIEYIPSVDAKKIVKWLQSGGTIPHYKIDPENIMTKRLYYMVKYMKVILF